MKNPFQKRTSIAAVEAEMTTLSKRRGEVATRIAEIKTASETAKAERRESLSIDGDYQGLTANIREMAIELADLEALIVDIDAQGEDAATRLMKAMDEAERATSASALEKIVLAAELRIGEIEKAAAGFAKTIVALKADMGDVNLWPAHGANRPEGSADMGQAFAGGREITAAIVAEALARQMPWLFDVALTSQGYRAGLFRLLDPEAVRPDWTLHHLPTSVLSVAEMLHAVVLNPLRMRAATIKDGGVELDKPAAKTVEDDYVRPQAPANVLVFVTGSFSYIATEFGPPTLCGEGWTQSVPLPVAELAEARHLAVRASSPRGEALLAAARKLKAHLIRTVRPEDCVELGDCMGLRATNDEVKRRPQA